MKIAKRNRLIWFTGIVVFGILIGFNPFARTEIVVLNQMTELGEDGVISQICLVKNPPYSSSALKENIDQFNATHPVKGKYYDRLFIKEHDYILFPTLFLLENVDYASKNTTREDLDNIDFLANSHNVVLRDGRSFKETECYTGKLWYYKY